MHTTVHQSWFSHYRALIQATSSTTGSIASRSTTCQHTPNTCQLAPNTRLFHVIIDVILTDVILACGLLALGPTQDPNQSTPTNMLGSNQRRDLVHLKWSYQTIPIRDPNRNSIQPDLICLPKKKKVRTSLLSSHPKDLISTLLQS